MSHTRLETGRKGEEAAARYLTEQGYQIVARNWRCRTGEIDIVATMDEIYVFVEVKTRTSKRFGTPQESVHTRKQQQVKQTANVFVYQNHLYDATLRFDFIAVLVA